MWVYKLITKKTGVNTILFIPVFEINNNQLTSKFKNMKKKILLTALVISALLTTRTSTAQINYGVTVSGGVSNINLVQKDKHTRFGNYFTASTQAAFDLFVSEKLKSKPISFEQGISVENFGFIQNVPKKYYDDAIIFFPDLQRMHEGRTWHLAIPLKVKYEVKKWVGLFAGISNVFIVRQDIPINQKYALRGELGADFLLANRYILGIEGGYDILPSGMDKEYGFYFRYYYVSAKVGILLSSLKK